MVRGIKGGLNDDFALPCMAQAFGSDKFFDPCLDGRAEGRGHGRKLEQSSGASTAGPEPLREKVLSENYGRAGRVTVASFRTWRGSPAGTP